MPRTSQTPGECFSDSQVFVAVCVSLQSQVDCEGFYNVGTCTWRTIASPRVQTTAGDGVVFECVPISFDSDNALCATAVTQDICNVLMHQGICFWTQASAKDTLTTVAAVTAPEEEAVTADSGNRSTEFWIFMAIGAIVLLVVLVAGVVIIMRLRRHRARQSFRPNGGMEKDLQKGRTLKKFSHYDAKLPLHGSAPSGKRQLRTGQVTTEPRQLPSPTYRNADEDTENYAEIAFDTSKFRMQESPLYNKSPEWNYVDIDELARSGGYGQDAPKIGLNLMYDSPMPVGHDSRPRTNSYQVQCCLFCSVRACSRMHSI